MLIVITLFTVSAPQQFFGYPDFSKVNRVLIIGSDGGSEAVVGMLSNLDVNGPPLATIFNIPEDG